MSQDVHPVPDFREQPGVVHVTVLRAPLRLWERSAQHNADLLREFSLITLSEQTADLPARLLSLIADLTDRYAGVGEQPRLTRQAALDAGELSVDLDYDVPVAAATSCQDLLLMLREADAFCDSGLLMTLPQPPDQQAFNEWYLQEFIRQIAGEPPTPWPGLLS